MSKSAWRIDEILFPKSSLKMGDSTYGTLRDMKLLLARMGVDLPSQTPPGIESIEAEAHNPRNSENPDVGQTF